jgi:hypothetical protein
MYIVQNKTNKIWIPTFKNNYIQRILDFFQPFEVTHNKHIMQQRPLLNKGLLCTSFYMQSSLPAPIQVKTAR